MAIIQSDPAGGILIADKTVIQQMTADGNLDEDFQDILSIAMDIDGTSDLTYSFPDEQWARVWQRETAPLLQLVHEQRIAVCLLNEGMIYADLELLGRQPDCGDCTRFESFVVTESGTIASVEIGNLVVCWDLEELAALRNERTTFVYDEVTVPPGRYRVSFDINRMAPSSQFNRYLVAYGDKTIPALSVRLHHDELRTKDSDLPRSLLQVDFRHPSAGEHVSGAS